MNDTHLIILNRTAAVAGDYIHVVPKGELPNRTAKLTQVLDDTALDAILANIAADKARLGDKWPGIYAGREHFIYNDEQDSAALAWFKEFEKRADGIWAKADGLTPTGKQVIANAEYKFTSFVADRRDTQDLGGGKVRILKLDTIGFTNQANGKELLTPITNRQEFRSTAAADSQHKQTTTGQKMKSVCTLLELSADASEEAVHAAVAKLKNRGDITVVDLKTLREEHETFKNRIKTHDDEQVVVLLDLHQVKEEKVRNRLTPVLAAMKNRDERVAALVDFGFKAGETKDTKKGQRLLNREQGKNPAEDVDASNEQELAQKAEIGRAHV